MAALPQCMQCRQVAYLVPVSHQECCSHTLYALLVVCTACACLTNYGFGRDGTDCPSHPRTILFLKPQIAPTTPPPYTLRQVDAELTARRAAMPGFVGLSFATIAGADSNGAVIHYRPQEETCRWGEGRGGEGRGGC